MVTKRKRKINVRMNLPTVGKPKHVLRLIVWGVLGLIVLISFLSMVRYGAVMSRLSQMEQQAMLQKRNTNAPISPRLTLYMQQFIPHYMTVTADNEDKRKKELRHYFVAGLTDKTTMKDAKRIFKQATLLEVKEGVARYIVHYVNQALTKTASATYKADAKGNQIPGVKEKITVSEHPVKSLLNIPYQEQEGQYCITGLPYFTAIPNLKAQLTMQEKTLPLSTAVDTHTSEAVSAFIDDFLRKYTTQSAKDMAYMMKEPTSIKDLYHYVSSHKIIQIEGDQLVAYVDAQFREKAVQMEHTERMKLILAKQDNKYVVNKLIYRRGK